MDQQYSLRWYNYFNHITEAYGSLRKDEYLVDVTLSCEGRHIKAHKMILSVFSSYFRDIFKETPCRHPVIVLPDAKYEDVLAIIDLMYQGEVKMLQDQLESFLTTADMMGVKGLTNDGSDRDEENKKKLKSREETLENEASINFTSISQTPDSSDSPQTKKRKKSVDSPQYKTPHPVKFETSPSQLNEVLTPCVPVIVKEDEIEDFTIEYDEDESETVDLLESENDLGTHDYFENDPANDSINYSIEPEISLECSGEDTVGGSKKKRHVCVQCGAKYVYRRSLAAHLKTHTGETKCQICGRVLSTKSGHRRHMAVVHNK